MYRTENKYLKKNICAVMKVFFCQGTYCWDGSASTADNQKSGTVLFFFLYRLLLLL
jgi:hypothetical protein